MKKYFDTVILGLGIFFLSFGCYLVYERLSPRDIVFASNDSVQAVEAPSRLTISSAHIDLPIYPAQIEGNKWQITTAGVSYLSTSPMPGTQGNSVMYGHNWGNLLGSLKKVKVGDKIVVTNSRGKALNFTVHFVSVVTPDETHIYKNTTDYRLTIYTCTGFLDSKRLVVTAILD